MGGAGNKYYMTGSAEGIFWTAIKMNDISCAPVTMKNSFWTVGPSSLFLFFSSSIHIVTFLLTKLLTEVRLFSLEQCSDKALRGDQGAMEKRGTQPPIIILIDTIFKLSSS